MMFDRLVIEGKGGTGKTTYLLNKYKELLDEGVPSEKIIVLLPNRLQKSRWFRETSRLSSGPRHILTYFGFVQKELQRYWTTIPDMKSLKPFFLTMESSQYLMVDILASKREEGYWEKVFSKNERLALEFIQNLSRAEMNNIDYHEIGERLYLSYEDRERLEIRDYQMMQECINEFRQTCLSKELLDYSLILNLYRTYLLENKEYQNALAERFTYLLIDDLQEAFAQELRFVDIFPGHKIVIWNLDGCYGIFGGAVPDRASVLIKDWERQALQDSYSASSENIALGDTLSQKILTGKVNGDIEHKKHRFIHKDLSYQAYQAIGLRVAKYLQDGIKADRIVILAPYVDNTMEFSLNDALSLTGHKVINLVRQTSFVDNIFIKALISLACLAHPKWDINVPEMDLQDCYHLLFGLDRIRASILAKATIKEKPYRLPDLDKNNLRERIGFKASESFIELNDWIENYQKKEPEELPVFWYKILTEFLIRLPLIEENLIFCRQLIDSATHFSEVMEKMGNGFGAKEYISFLQSGIKGAENLELLEEKMKIANGQNDELDNSSIILTTPHVYLSTGARSDVQIWLDVNNDGWYASDRQVLANIHVLNENWSKGDIFFEEMDMQKRKEKMASICRLLLNKCSGSLDFIGTMYNMRGIEQDGILEELLQEILSEREEVRE